MDNKLVVITNGNYFARLVLDKLFENRAAQLAGVLVITGDYKKRGKLSALYELSKCTTMPYLLYKMMTYGVFVVAERLYPKACLSVEKLAAAKGVPTYESVAVNTEAARAWVAGLGPDLLISVSCPQLIGRKMLSIPRLGGVNIHSSLLPSYAGLAPYFWVLSAGEKRAGTTVHYMTDGFDKGNILRQESLAVEPRESAFCLFERLAKLGSDVLDQAVTLALDGAEGTKQDLEDYTYFSHPTFKAYRSLRRHGFRLARTRELFRTIRQETTAGNQSVD